MKLDSKKLDSTMTGENSTSKHSAEQDNQLPIFSIYALHTQSLSMLHDLLLNLYDADHIHQAEEFAKSQMTCVVEVALKEKLKQELTKAKQLLKTKFPIRYRWQMIKIYLHPAAIVGFILLGLKSFKKRFKK